MRNIANENVFIAQELEKWSTKVADLVTDALRDKGIGISSELEKSIRSRARQNIGELLFKGYGRMVDMGAGRGSKKGIESISSNRQQLRNGRKPKRFYSKIAYGTLSGLIQSLVNGYQEEIIYTAKTRLES